MRMDSAWLRRCDDMGCAYRTARRAKWEQQVKDRWLKEHRPRAIEKLKRVAGAMYQHEGTLWDGYRLHLEGYYEALTSAQAARKTVIDLREALELEAKIDEEKARKDWL